MSDFAKDTNVPTNDCISRQVAIDVLEKILPADPMRNDYTEGITCGAALAMEYIKQLPSAKPERKTDGDTISRQAAINAIHEIEHIDCEGWELIDDIEECLKQLPSAQQWIPVTERLPDKDVPVLVYLFGDVPHIAWINRDGEWETEEFIIDCDYLPKAWSPLPEPFKGGDDK